MLARAFDSRVSAATNSALAGSASSASSVALVSRQGCLRVFHLHLLGADILILAEIPTRQGIAIRTFQPPTGGAQVAGLDGGGRQAGLGQLARILRDRQVGSSHIALGSQQAAIQAEKDIPP